MSTSVHVILNALAGANRDIKTMEQRLVHLFTRHSIMPHIVLARSGQDLLDLGRRLLHQGSQILVAGGGDGTISAVASVLAGTGFALGILPLGTLNHFAKDVGIPLDLEDAVDTILNGQVVNVDVGEVNGRVFINNSSLGLYPSILRHRQQQQKRQGRSKWLALARAIPRVLSRSPVLRAHLWLDGNEIVRHTPFIFIGNNTYQIEEGKIASRTRLDAGILSLYTAQPVSRLGLLKLVLHFLAGQLHGRDDFSAFTGKHLIVKTPRKRLRVAADGELLVLKTPLHYRIRPGALHVLVPAHDQTRQA